MFDQVDAKTRARIPELVDFAIEAATRVDYLTPGCRAEAIEAASRQTRRGALVDVISDVLQSHRVVWSGDDPHDTWGRN